MCVDRNSLMVGKPEQFYNAQTIPCLFYLLFDIAALKLLIIISLNLGFLSSME